MVALEAFSIMYIVDIGRIGLSNGPCVYQMSVSSIINKTPQVRATFFATLLHVKRKCRELILMHSFSVLRLLFLAISPLDEAPTMY